MTSYRTRVALLAAVALANPVEAQYPFAVAVAIIILLVGFTMRRRRARAFKTAYPLQSYPQTGNTNGGQGLPYAQQPHTGGAWNGYGQGGYGQPQPQTGGNDYPAPPPQYSGYRADSNSHYEQPNSTTQYAPPQSPPPAASQSTSQPYYAPPAGPPPTSGGK
ncbi:hypothetical protein JCM16303_005763 [Sporobolomyces ruberrimus]